jgi:hypothetical protein
MSHLHIKNIGAPGSFARLEQVVSRERLYDLLGAAMLAAGLNPTEAQTLAVADQIAFSIMLEFGT